MSFKIAQTSGKKVYFQFPERRISFAKIVKGKSNDKTEKQSFSGFGIAEPHPILCKDTPTIRHYKIKKHSPALAVCLTFPIFA